MKVQHIFNGHFYLITNHAVASNSIFDNKVLCERFLRKVEFYLSPLCEVLHYVMHENQFQLVVKMASREAFEAYYWKKNGLAMEGKEVPFSTHIFSQAMANLQSSTAIHYNRKFGRTGALFARRFAKVLIESEEKLDEWINRLNLMKRFHEYLGKWKRGIRRKKEKVESWKMKKERSAYYYYLRQGIKHSVLSTFVKVFELNLQGQFNILPPPSIYIDFLAIKTLKYVRRKPAIP